MVDPRYLLDTNVCIYLLAGASDALNRRVQRCAVGQLAISSIVWAEVVRGIDLGDARSISSLQSFFAAIPILPFDETAATSYARVPFRRGSFDRLIAAHALALGLVVVTANTSDFADVTGLVVEDWTAP